MRAQLERSGIWIGMQSQDIDVNGPSRSVLYSMLYGVHRSGLAVRPWRMHSSSAACPRIAISTEC